MLKRKEKDARRKRRDELSLQLVSGLGELRCPPAHGALGYCWGWAGGRAAFSFPHLPWNHLQKKNRKNKRKCLQSTLSTVPLTLLMPNRHIQSRSSLGARGHRGGCADSGVPLPLVLFYFFSYTQPCFLHLHSHANLVGACFLGGVRYLPPPRLFPLLLGAVGRAV